MKKPTVSVLAVSAATDARIGVELRKYPALAEFLFGQVYATDPPEPRQPGRVLISPREEGVQVTLKEPSSAVEAVLVVPSLDGLWKLLDSFLADDKARWKPDPWAKPPGKRRGR